MSNKIPIICLCILVSCVAALFLTVNKYISEKHKEELKEIKNATAEQVAAIAAERRALIQERRKLEQIKEVYK